MPNGKKEHASGKEWMPINRPPSDPGFSVQLHTSIHPSAAFRLPGPGPALPGRCSDGSYPLPPGSPPVSGFLPCLSYQLGCLFARLLAWVALGDP